ncbi:MULTISPECIES: ATP-grasp domain-containing protein [unclassified Actinomyces]|uniref:5-(carboxyamino)imidazole ribonucleotide synthase n=1 Tax=unclassified Actinomyces TaxID=2609248 RepID=UPI0020177D3F|nr:MULTISPECIES: ATP-grasp domain-containing protein [unclassified Actinomyces]MCL3776965.1 ATP-grasp domain-containing protein [Actinomyces sp. AC-20-1]MCL3790231.1 ATP-grasp domain-containing protein [Actinomyces sp. 187325]MCL3792755.1 ATP-grasp domain-containing protein [Actinomyces sp. 186855]MCL3795233.1 ATP-grasp domain-containing protein [Actinomyces sp. 217892]
MMQEEASALGIHLRALVEAADGSTAQVVVDAPVGGAGDAGAVRALVAGTGTRADPSSAPRLQAAVPADVLTFEHEHQDSDLLAALVAEGVSVQPGPDALLLARDKIAMRRAMTEVGAPQPAWAEVTGTAEQIRDGIESFASRHGWPVVLKTPRGGYDGHGVLLVRSTDELHDGEAATWVTATAAAATGGGAPGPVGTGGGSLGGGAVTSLLIEQAVPFTRELAVLLARSPSGETAVWPVVESVQADGICAEVIAPAPGLDDAATELARATALAIAEHSGVTGVLAVELFAVEAHGEPTRLLVNELAMRPHNSGHWTQDGAATSQFAQHLRAVLDLPLGSTEPTAAATVMVNLLGGEQEPDDGACARALAADPGARIHLYGKQWRPGRKLGHVNVTVPGDPASPAPPEPVAEARRRARAVVAVLRGEA